MKNLIRVIGIGIIIGIILMVIDQILRIVSGDGLVFGDRFWTAFSYYMLYSIPLTLVNSYFFDYLHGGNKGRPVSKYKIVQGLLGSILITLVTFFFVRMFISMILEGESYPRFMTTERIDYYIVATLITLVISLFFHALYYYRELQKNKIKEQKVIAGTASAKFDALKNQLDPHFLFNSLNVLTSLIDENPDSAQEFTSALSKVYRYVLEQKNKELVTVDEELDFARTYMSLLKMRFEDSIKFHIPEKASSPDSKVVPLSLQLLLENAVKHNMVTTNKPLEIRIFEDNGHLVVENNLQPKQIVKKGSGVGLSNIKQRYEMLSNRKVIVNQEANRFIVALPMLTKQVTVMRSESKPQFEDKLIESGRVYVNGEQAEIGMKVSVTDKISVDGESIKNKDEKHVYLAFNKPVGIVCTTDTRVEKNNIIDYINYPKRIFPIGRLDKMSEGLILLTDDGDIVNEILRESKKQEKEYIVTVDKPISQTFVKRMAGGVPILDTVTKKCKVERLDNYTFRIILTQGLNRQIRRMAEYLGYQVKTLKRVRIINIKLDLPLGKYRELTSTELNDLRKALKNN